MRITRFAAGSALALSWTAACFDSGLRWEELPRPTDAPPLCDVGTKRCWLDHVEQCDDAGAAGTTWSLVADNLPAIWSVEAAIVD